MKEALLAKLNEEKETLEEQLGNAELFEKTHVFGLMDQYNHVLQRIDEANGYDAVEVAKPAAKKAAAKKKAK